MRPRRFSVPRVTSWLAALIFVCLYAPIVLVVLNSFNGDEDLVGWGGFTTRWWDQALSNARVRDDFVTSLLIAIATTLISLVLALTVATWARRASPRARRVMDGSTYMRLVLPEIVFALGLFLLLTVTDIPLGMGTIVIGHVVIYSAYATIIIQARMETLSGRLEEAAVDLGATPVRAFRRVTLPLLMPGVLVAAMLTFTFSFDNVVISQFLGGSDTETLPVLMMGLIRVHVTPEVNAIGTGVMVMTLLTFVIAGLIAALRPTGASALIGTKKGGDA